VFEQGRTRFLFGFESLSQHTRAHFPYNQLKGDSVSAPAGRRLSQPDQELGQPFGVPVLPDAA